MKTPRSSLALLAALLAAVAAAAPAQPAAPLPALKVSDNRRFLVTADGRPFFWLGDTAWELFHRLDREQAVAYLDLRAKQRYNVIQAVALAELQGITDPNAQGDLPLVDRDPARPAVTPGNDPRDPAAYDYWDHVDFIVAEANRRGMYVGFLPTWGSWAPNERKEDTSIIFDEKNAQAFGEFLGRRYAKSALVWILGGDRPSTGVEYIWRAMARGIALGAAGKEDYSGLLMTYHPRGGLTSSTSFHNDVWLDFNMLQTGHSPQPLDAPQKTTWQKVAADYRLEPVKPVLDGEPLYEDHPIGFRAAKEHGYSFDAHVRQRAWWHVFAGAFGHTYGHHSVWQMYVVGRRPVNGPLFQWHEAIHRPGADQMRHLRALVESRPMLSRVPDQSLVVDALSGADYIAATRGDGYAFVYSAQGRAFSVDLDRLGFGQVAAWWYNPRNGVAEKAFTKPAKGTEQFVPHLHGGLGTDCVLVLDDVTKNFPAPGTSPAR